MTAHERTGWRDKELSLRHRVWGFNCPAVDLDFLMVEYNFGLPVALVEYKHARAQKPDLQHATYRAIADLANNYRPKNGRVDGLPFIIAKYWPETWAFRLMCANDIALAFYKQQVVNLSERGYVASLYRIRKLTVHDETLAKLNTVLPAEAA